MTEAISADGKIKVEWVDLGEGVSGDYNPDDPEDEPLLRFDTYQRDETGEWVEFEDGSYCTNTRCDESEETLQKLVQFLADRIADDPHRKTAERLSWIDPSWLITKGQPA